MPDIHKTCAVRPIKASEVQHIINYFLNSDLSYLKKLGTSSDKLPAYDEWYKFMLDELNMPYSKNTYYGLGWWVNNKLIGHSCISHIEYGKQAHFHIHIWEPSLRCQGLGLRLLPPSLNAYFKHFKLSKLASAPSFL